MVARKLAVLLLIFVVSCVTFPRTEITPPTVWKLYSLTNSGSCFPILCKPEGSLWRVLVLTSAHIVAFQAESWSISHHNGNILLDGNVIASHPTEDAAILEFYAEKPVKINKISSTPVKYGEKLVTVGYPGGMGPYITTGIASIPGYHSVPGYLGNSGGPIARENGEIVGIFSGMWIHHSSLVFFVGTYLPLVNIFEWLEKELKYI